MLRPILVVLTLVLALVSFIGYSYKAKKWKRVFVGVICVTSCIIWQVVTLTKEPYPLIVGGWSLFIILCCSWKNIWGL
jgi:hypothetical protein